MYSYLAIGVLVLALAGSGWLHLKQSEERGIYKAQVSTLTDAVNANAQMWADERADRERAQRVAARRQGRINELEAAAAAAEERTYVPPEENGPIAPVLRRELDRLPEQPAAGDAVDAGPGGDGGSAVPGADARTHAPGT